MTPLHTTASDLRTLAHLASTLCPALAAALTLQADRIDATAVDVRRMERTLDEIVADAAEDDAWQRRARIIAKMMEGAS